jgi:hypothetical protein
MTFTFTAVVKATAAKFNFAACSRHAKCSFRVRLHTKIVRDGRQEFPDWANMFVLEYSVVCGCFSYSFVFSGHGDHSGNIHRRSEEVATSYGEMDRSIKTYYVYSLAFLITRICK